MAQTLIQMLGMPSSDAEDYSGDAEKQQQKHYHHHFPHHYSGNLGHHQINLHQPHSHRTVQLLHQQNHNLRGATTWHEHIYAAPPRAPTPHRISDILGWTSLQQSVRVELVKPSPRRFAGLRYSSSPNPVAKSPNLRCDSQSKSTEELDRPLNLCTGPRTRSLSMSPASTSSSLPILEGFFDGTSLQDVKTASIKQQRLSKGKS